MLGHSQTKERATGNPNLSLHHRATSRLYPRIILYDNLKSAVLERRRDAIRFHPTLLELAAHYHFAPRPVAVARGNEKGRVERAIKRGAGVR